MALNEFTAVGAVSTFAGFVMSDATWALLIGQLGIIGIMIVKDRRDLKNREQDRLDRESAANLLKTGLAEVATKGGEREERIVAKVEEVKSAVADAPKSPQQVEVVGTVEAHIQK